MDPLKEKTILYIGFFQDDFERLLQPYASLAAIDKMNYIANVMIRTGCKVEILSPTWSTSKKWRYYPGMSQKTSKDLLIKYMPTISSPLRILRILAKYYALVWLFYQLLRNTNRNSNVFLYHSVLLYLPIKWAKKIRNFCLTLEVEEIYNLFTARAKREEDILISIADNYIFSNKLIHEYFNRDLDKAKRFIVLNGTYNVVSDLCEREKSNDLVKVVYAGNIDDIRGAFNAVACSGYLSDKYQVYIIGYGKEESINKLNYEIVKVNNQAEHKKCEYLGKLSWKEYNEFLFGCDIAINPQEPDESYMQYAFPSKVLSYLGHNLRTVSTKLKCIEISEFSDLVVLVDSFTPEKFAKAIMAVDLQSPFNAVEIIKNADTKFGRELESLMDSNNIAYVQ